MKITDSQIRSYGMLMVLQYLVNIVGKNIVSTTQLKLKQQINTIINNSELITRNYESLKLLKNASKSLNKELDSSVISDEIETAKSLIVMINDLLIDGDAVQIYDAVLYLRNLKEGKKLFTEEEFKLKLEQYETTNI